MTEEELLALLDETENKSAELFKRNEAKVPAVQPVFDQSLDRSVLLPVATDRATGQNEFAAPQILTEPVEAVHRFMNSLNGVDYEQQGVPATTPQQIQDAATIAGTIDLPALATRPVAPQVFINPLPNVSLPNPVKKLMKTSRIPQPPVVKKVIEVAKDAPDDLETLETAKDLYKTYVVDEKTALTDIAERAGVPDPAKLKQEIDQSTQLTALMRVNESLRTGKLRTTTGDFDVPVAPEVLYMKVKNLPELAQQDADQYMKLMDMTDDLKLRIAKNIDVAASQQMLNDTLTSLSQIEQRTPVVKELAQDYRNITGAVRDFLSKGKNAMLDQKAVQALGQERPNYVPIDIHGINPNDPLMSRMVDAQRQISKDEMDDWFLQKRDLTKLADPNSRVNSFETLIGYTRNALQTKMEHDTRGMYVDQIAQSQFGQNTMRKLKDDEVGKYGNRVVEVYENGKKVKYVASKLQADLLRFDPHVAKFPAFYATKRMFEMGTTGAVGMTFAPMTMIRDMLTGLVLAPKGMGKPTPWGTAKAVTDQLYYKGALAASNILKSSFNDLPFLPKGAKDQLADTMADAYARSTIALANSVGGVDSSLIRSSIDFKKGVIHEVKRSLEQTAGQIPGANFLGHSVRHLWNGWEALFSSISEAPRYAAFENALKKGVDPSTAAVEARKIAGDATRSGRVYKPDGTRIDADAVNKESLVGAAAAGKAAQFAREAIPYTNPTLQGLRRVASRFIENPVEVGLNAWKYVGLPAVAAYGWNEMLGPEYNDYAMKRRASRDQAMTIYVGLPNRPPEEGLEIPIPHELMFWNSPFTTAIYNSTRGDQDVMQSVKHMAATILQNGSMLGYPVGFSQAFTAAGMRPPESIMTPWADVYELREDNVGFFPQNVEALLRQTFGGVTDLVLQSAAAGYQAGPMAFADEFAAQWAKKVPFVKNLSGSKTATNAFTPLSSERQRKVQALNTFRDAWEEHFNPAAYLRLRSSKLPELSDDIDEDSTTNDVSTGAVAPPTSPVPTNPVFKQFGQLIKSYTGTNDQGMTALNSRYSVLTEQIQRLRGYSAGNADQFKQWQKLINGSEAKYAKAVKAMQDEQEGPVKEKKLKVAQQYEEVEKTAKFIKQHKLDMSKRDDVVILINELEKQRTTIIDEQMQVIKRLEDVMTEELHKNGMLPPNVRFDVEKHLIPLVPKDFKTSSPG